METFVTCAGSLMIANMAATVGLAALPDHPAVEGENFTIGTAVVHGDHIGDSHQR
ncbi:MAG TPA: hypothetical protein VI585_01075 [Candidatus Binatia bacterium]